MIPPPPSDYVVMVCTECKRASCWHGDFSCERASEAGIEEMPASELRAMGREHPAHYSPARIRQVTGAPPRAI